MYDGGLRVICIDSNGERCLYVYVLQPEKWCCAKLWNYLLLNAPCLVNNMQLLYQSDILVHVVIILGYMQVKGGLVDQLNRVKIDKDQTFEPGLFFSSINNKYLILKAKIIFESGLDLEIIGVVSWPFIINYRNSLWNLASRV